MPRLSITLTESQAAALERIAAETGATKQSMIGLAVSAWIRENDVTPAGREKSPQNRPQGLSGWYGWSRTAKDGEGSRDHDRQRFDTEADAVEHAKASAARLRDSGEYRIARPMWEECDDDGVPVWLNRGV